MQRKSLRKIANYWIQLGVTYSVVVGLFKERWVISRVGNAQRASFIGGIKYPKSAPHDGVLEHVVSEADTRREIQLLIGNQALRRVAIDGDLRIEIRRQRILPACCDIECVGIDVEIGLGTILLLRVLDEFIAQAEVERQLVVYLEIILYIVKLARLLELVVDEGGDLRKLDRSQQEIGLPQSRGCGVLEISAVGELASKAERAARDRRLQDGEIHTRFNFGANLYGVAAADQGQTVDKLVHLLRFYRGLIFRAAKGVEPGHGELRQTSVVRAIGDAGNAHRR